jgi:hypothetical protein
MGSTLIVDEIRGATTAANIKLPDGYVVQVQSTTKTDTQSITGTTAVDVLTVSITPKFATSKIYVKCDLNFTSKNGSSNLGERYAYAKLFRDTTQIALGDAAGSRQQVWFACNTTNTTNDAFRMSQSSGSFYDSPATTSAITYKVKCATTSTSTDVITINSSGADPDAAYSHRGVSTITVMEIAQ